VFDVLHKVSAEEPRSDVVQTRTILGQGKRVGPTSSTTDVVGAEVGNSLLITGAVVAPGARVASGGTIVWQTRDESETSQGSPGKVG